jgi:ribosomal protein S12 methylthiotransferase accessory factor
MTATHARTGIVLPPRDVPTDPCDVPGIVNVAVPAEPSNAWQGTAGAVAFGDWQQARQAAVAEALERYAASRAMLPSRLRCELEAPTRDGRPLVLDDSDFALFSKQQLATPGFPWPSIAGPDDVFMPMFRLNDNRMAWVPREAVGLGVKNGHARWPTTSSGLAAQRDSAGTGPWRAVLRATQEVLERDALAVSWLNGLGGREIPLPKSLADPVRAMGAEVHALDLTQRWNPHPVVAVMGRMDAEGQPRHAFGIACRASVTEAMDKAWLEWAQSLRYAEFMRNQTGFSIPREPAALRRFDEHAAYYTFYPEGWSQLALLRHRAPVVVRGDAAMAQRDDATQLTELVTLLAGAAVDLYYQELTTADVAQAGLRVVRVVAPILSPLHADERAPFLGGRCADTEWRYPDLTRHMAGPNPWPHPLG